MATTEELTNNQEQPELEEDDYNYRYSLRNAYKLWLEGERVWYGLGNFMNDFYKYFPEERQSLLDAPIEEPADATDEQHRWAVFFAASAEFFAHKFGLEVPAWSQDEKYAPLGETWYFEPIALVDDSIRAYEERGTAPEFKRRNIICGERVYWNKWERIPAPDAATMEEEIQFAKAAAEK